MSSGSSQTRIHAPNIPHVLSAIFLLKNGEWLPLVERLTEEAGTGKDLEISSFDGHVQYVCMEEDVIRTVEAAFFSMKNPITTYLFHAVSFQK